MWVTLELSVGSRCKQCSWLTPVPGIRNTVTCGKCAATSDFAARVKDSRDGGLKYAFGAYYDALAEAAILLDEGQDCRDARDSQGTPTALKKATPRCRACQGVLPLPAAGAASVTCPGCREDIAVRWPDDETRTWDDRIVCILDDGKGRGAAMKELTGQANVVGCGRCGAALTAGDGDRRRSRACTHCGAANYLPDAAWLALFPLPEHHRCYLVYDVDPRRLLALHAWIARTKKYWLKDAKLAEFETSHARARAAARGEVVAALFAGQATDDEVRGLAIDPALTDAEAAAIDARLDDKARGELVDVAAPALVPRWASATIPQVRRAVAKHPATPGAVLEALADDGDADVRAVVAARAETPPATIKKLRKDPDAAVARAAKANPAYKAGFFEGLLGG